MGRLAHTIALALLSSVAACELVLGMENHPTLTAVADGGSDGTASRDAGDGGPVIPCKLPSSGDARVRIGDVVPSADRFDFCLQRTDGGPDPTSAPILSTNGCPPGLAYKDVLVPFSVPAGTYDVSAVAPGMGCGTPLATAHSVLLASSTSTGLYLFGAQASDAQLTPFLESNPAQLDTDLRFIHAVPGASPFDFGVTDSPSTPASIISVVFQGVPFGATSPAGSSQLGAIDANGYVEFTLANGKLNVGVAPTGSTAATLAQNLSTAADGVYTAFAIGKTDDVAFPEELYICDEGASDGIYTRCGGTPQDVTFDVFNAYLYGVLGPFTTLREPAIYAAPALLSGDFACFTDVYTDPDKAAIVAAAPANGFPYTATFLGDSEQTPVDDPSTADGGAPAEPTGPPCAGALASQLDALMDCAVASCASVPNDGDASLTPDDPISCMSGQCASQTLALALGDSAAQVCWQCASMEFYSSTPFSTARTECKTLTERFYAFHGASSPVLLSRHPLANVTQWVLPSTNWRVSVIRADVALENGASLAAYCTELTSPAAGATLPYTGAYGEGLTGIAAWQAEQILQIQRLAAYVTRTSAAAGQKALVMGDFYTGPTVPNVLDPYNPDSYAVLSAAFATAAPPGYPPACTFCVDNPITTPPGTTPSGSSTWSSAIFLSGIPVTDVHAASVLLQQPVLDAGSYLIPLSSYYAYQATVHVRPP